MKNKYLPFATIIIFALFALTASCSSSNLFDINHTFFSAQNSCHTTSSDFKPTESMDFTAAILKDQSQAQDEFLGALNSNDTTGGLLAIAVTAVFALFLVSKRKILRFIRKTPRLFNKWVYLFRKGILHPQIW
ncbi:MAG: hypothetical protein ABEJ24_03795 [Candidatus Magasanikbacteria bacterium]